MIDYQQYIEDADLIEDARLDADPDATFAELIRPELDRLQAFRRDVREALGLGWDASDAQILGALQRRTSK